MPLIRDRDTGLRKGYINVERSDAPDAPEGGASWAGGPTTRSEDWMHGIAGPVIINQIWTSEDSQGKVKIEIKPNAYLSGANLSGMDLHDVDLSGSILHRLYLTDTNLSGADLHETDLYSAYLFRTNLEGSNLRGANLTKANLSGTNLKDADLAGANLTDIKGWDTVKNLYTVKNLNKAINVPKRLIEPLTDPLQYLNLNTRYYWDPYTQDICPICKNSLREGRYVRTDCGHEFHDTCLSKWKKVSETCPLCREPNVFFGSKKSKRRFSKNKKSRSSKKSKKSKRKFSQPKRPKFKYKVYDDKYDVRYVMDPWELQQKRVSRENEWKTDARKFYKKPVTCIVGNRDIRCPTEYPCIIISENGTPYCYDMNAYSKVHNPMLSSSTPSVYIPSYIKPKKIRRKQNPKKNIIERRKRETFLYEEPVFEMDY